MSRIFRNRFIACIVFILIAGCIVGGQSELGIAVNDALGELPFMGDTWNLVSKIVSVSSAGGYTVRSFWEELLRSLFVALVSIPFQRLLGLIVGFRYHKDDTYDTPRSLQNRFRDFFCASIAILTASMLYVLLTKSGILNEFMPEYLLQWRLLLICLAMIIVDYLFFRYSMSTLRIPIFFRFIANLLGTILQIQLMVFLICLLVAGLQSAPLKTSIITILIALAGLTIMFRGVDRLGSKN